MAFNSAQHASVALALEDARKYAEAAHRWTLAAIVETVPGSKVAWQRNADECNQKAREQHS